MWTLAFYSQISQVIPELHTPLLCIAVSGLHNTATQPKVIYPMDLEVKGKGFDFDNLLDFNQGRINIARVYAEAYAD